MTPAEALTEAQRAAEELGDAARQLVVTLGMPSRTIEHRLTVAMVELRGAQRRLVALAWALGRFEALVDSDSDGP